jgi:hypothetical protein
VTAPPTSVAALQHLQLGNGAGVDEEGQRRGPLAQQHTELGGAADEDGVATVPGLDREQCSHRRRPLEASLRSADVDGGAQGGRGRMMRAAGRAAATAHLHEAVVDDAGIAHLQGVAHGLADGAIAGATTEVAAQLVGEGRRVLRRQFGALVRLEHRRHEARRAVAALAAEVPHHRRLHRMQAVCIGEALGGDDLATKEQSHRRDAGGDGPPRRLSGGVDVGDGDGAGAAVPLGAALLGARLPARPQEPGQRRVVGVDAGGVDVDDDAVDGEGAGTGHGRNLPPLTPSCRLSTVVT